MDNVDKCTKWNHQKCKRCKQHFTGYPAICRVDNKTEICSNCGVEQAIEQFKAYFFRENLVEAKIRS